MAAQAGKKLSDLGKQYKYGHFPTRILQNLHRIWPRFCILKNMSLLLAVKVLIWVSLLRILKYLLMNGVYARCLRYILQRNSNENRGLVDNVRRDFAVWMAIHTVFLAVNLAKEGTNAF